MMARITLVTLAHLNIPVHEVYFTIRVSSIHSFSVQVGVLRYTIPDCRRPHWPEAVHHVIDSIRHVIDSICDTLRDPVANAFTNRVDGLHFKILHSGVANWSLIRTIAHLSGGWFVA